MYNKLLAGAVATLMVALPLRAQTPAEPPTNIASPVTPAPAPVPYQPSLSDLMNIGVQPRHIKLWLAGKEHNWTYAAYQLNELRNALARVARTVPVYRTLNLTEVISNYTQQALTELDAAIKAQDAKAFVKGYADLNASCNACHVGAEHSMVVIKVPDTNAYVDQDFRAKH